MPQSRARRGGFTPPHGEVNSPLHPRPRLRHYLHVYVIPPANPKPFALIITPGPGSLEALLRWGSGVIWRGTRFDTPVIPAKAGIQSVDSTSPKVCRVDSRFRGNDCDFLRPALANDATTRAGEPGDGFASPNRGSHHEPQWMRAGQSGEDGRRGGTRTPDPRIRNPLLYPPELHAPKHLQLSGYGVGDGIRTRDVQIHSLALYQLSYTHHKCAARVQVVLIPL